VYAFLVLTVGLPSKSLPTNPGTCRKSAMFCEYLLAVMIRWTPGDGCDVLWASRMKRYLLPGWTAKVGVQVDAPGGTNN
jgi:hypothetical protein